MAWFFNLGSIVIHDNAGFDDDHPKMKIFLRMILILTIPRWISFFLRMIAHPTESRHTQRPDRSSHGELLQMFGKKDKWDQSTEHFGFWTILSTSIPNRFFLKTKHVTSFFLLQFSTWREHSPSTGGNSEVSTKSTLTWPRMSIPWVNLV